MMRTPRSGYRWFVIAVFFCFMLLHQSDKLLIGPLTPAIMDEFGISMTQMGAVTTGALVVASILYPNLGVSIRPVFPCAFAGAGIVHLGFDDLVERSGAHLPNLSDGACLDGD